MLKAFMELTRSLSEPLFLVSREGEIKALNPAVSGLLGRDADLFVGRRLAELVTDDPGKVSHYLEACSRSGDPVPGGLCWRMDGQVMACRCNGRLLPSDGRDPLVLLQCKPRETADARFLALNRALEELRVSRHRLRTASDLFQREVDERIRAEQALQESQERLLTILDSLDAMVYVADMKTHEIIFMNKYGRDLFGDVKGKICWQTLQAGQTGPCGFCSNDKIVDESGNPTGTYQWEHRNTRTERWFYTLDRAIKWAGGGIVRLEIATDITERKRTEQALQESEERLRLFSDVSSEGIIFHDQGLILDVNAACASLLGYDSEAAMRGGSIFDLVAPEYFELVKENIKLPVVERHEVRLRKRTGATFPAEVLAREYEFQGRRVRVTSLRDVSERKSVEEALRQSEERYRVLFEGAPDAILIIDRESGRILDANQAACRLMRMTCDDLFGLELSRLQAPLGRAPLGEQIMGHFRDSVHPDEVRSFENAVLRADGAEVPVEILVHEVTLGGRPALHSVFRDISEHKRSQETLRLAGSYNRSLIEASLDPLVTIGPDGRITDVNAATEAVTGYPREKLIGTDFSDYFTDTEKARQVYGQVFREGFVRDYPLEIRHRDGQVVSVLYNATLYRDEQGRVAGVFAAARDISERQRAEREIRNLNEELEQRVVQRTAALEQKGRELEDSQIALMNIVEDLNLKTAELGEANVKLAELDRLKSLFIASMSHELRTPLNSVIGFSSILLNEWLGPLTEEQKENLATILRSGKHLLNLINDVIDVSKIESGKIVYNVEEFELADLLTEAVNVVQKEARDKGLSLTLEAERRSLRTDRRRLLQCVLNLLSNAVKFTEKGGITVLARCEPGAGEADLVRISVQDTGMGIREEDRSKLFQPFVRLVSPLQATIPGTGLGLYLTRKLATDVLKGDILCESSALGAGSRFILSIPERIA